MMLLFIEVKMNDNNWIDIGSVDELSINGIQEVMMGNQKIALTFKDGVFGAISGVCNHVGGPLGKGRLEGEYIICPWHYWKFHFKTGEGEPGYEADRVPSHDIKVESGRVLVNPTAKTTRNKLPHPAHPLARDPNREPGPLRVLGISTTAMDPKNPRYSTSEELLKFALEHGQNTMGLETKLIRLSDLSFRNCEGFYSKNAKACTWPCSITQMDPADEMEKVYEGIVHWADVILLATPIRWGAASSLYFKMVERMNCIQNEITNNDRVLINNKVASFIITGGQDNVQGVAGQLLGFFSELGFVLPPFPYVAHSLGWSAENMERNINYVKRSKALREASVGLLERAVEMSNQLMNNQQICKIQIHRGGRKAFNPEA
jgi:nitrite reductase/ring-hydroxylating ferredoxin subunit/multimeric flavodoxin WrbA